MSCFWFQQFSVDQYKQIFCAVPPYGKNNNFLLWYSWFVSVVMGFCLCVPLVQTMNDGDPLGAWFPNLLVHVQLDVENVFGDVLASLLRYKSTGLILDPAFPRSCNNMTMAIKPSMTFSFMQVILPCRPNRCSLLSLVSILTVSFLTTVWPGMSIPCSKLCMGNICQISTLCNSSCLKFIIPFKLMSASGLNRLLLTHSFMTPCPTCMLSPDCLFTKILEHV